MRRRDQPREVHSRLAGDAAQLWRLESFYGLELLSAYYSRHIFPRHLHKTFVIEVVELLTRARFRRLLSTSCCIRLRRRFSFRWR
jgi:hypothetical protein